MAYYAYIDENNIVVTITVGKDETELINGLDTETYYAQGTPYTVKRTSYNGNIRGIYAGVGFSYNPEEDIFVIPQPYPSWIRNGSFWEAPTPMPTDGQMYQWVEADLNWQAVINPEDIFVTPQPYPSWTRNGSFWEPPTPMPTEGGPWMWVEDDLNWQVVPTE